MRCLLPSTDIKWNLDAHRGMTKQPVNVFPLIGIWCLCLQMTLKRYWETRCGRLDKKSTDSFKKLLTRLE